jgi:hypothetical protein
MQLRILVKDKSFKESDSGIAYHTCSASYYPAQIQISEDFDKETGEYVNWQDIDVTLESSEY